MLGIRVVKRQSVSIALTLIVFMSLVMSGSPALAQASCPVSGGQGSSNAWVTDYPDNCYQIYVKHQYDPSWSTSNYWTSYYSTTGSYVSTPSNPTRINQARFGYW